ncbi:MAG: hypothetical protein RLT30_06195, partial [Gammaproteobacteria bacterium]
MAEAQHIADFQSQSEQQAIGYEEICDQLLIKSLVDQTELSRCIDLYQENDVPLGILLVRMGLVADKDMANTFQDACGLPAMENKHLPATPVNDDQLSRKFLQDSFILPLEETDNELVVAMADPLDAFSRQAL